MTTWLTLAACRDADPALFDTGSDSGGYYPRAIRICAECPVQAECLEDALRFEVNAVQPKDISTVRGGLTPTQRRRLTGQRAGAR